MIKFCEYGFVFLMGAWGYSIIELLWRHYTHWSMAVTGGICLMILYGIHVTVRRGNRVRKAVFAALSITAIEFAVGMLVNRTLGWHVWDYSENFGNILGQVCPLYTVLWFFLSFPVFWICEWIHKNFYLKILS